MQPLTAFLLVLLLALGPLPLRRAQETPAPRHECGTEVTPQQIKAELEYLQRRGRPQLAPRRDKPYYAPLAIHIIRRNDGSGGFSLARLAVALRDLNLMWQPAGVQFFQYGPVDYIDDEKYRDLPASLFDELRRKNVIAGAINVYFVNSLTGANKKSLCGLASYSGNDVQGILMSNGCAGTSDNPTTFAHEVGHYFNLYHTHETGFGKECPSGNNCATAGDQICDTPADPDLTDHVNKDCEYDNSVSAPDGCDSAPYAPSTKNLMSYSTKLCRDRFTPEQIKKALQVLTTLRGYLISDRSWYVTAGADAVELGCAESAPCSLNVALRLANPGDSIFLRAGSYPGARTLNQAVSFKKWGGGPVPATIGR
jgi:hypothetical protein